MVTANGSGLGKVWVLLGDGTGSFGPRGQYLFGFNFFDIVRRRSPISTATGGVSVLLGNGDGTFQPHVDFATSPGARSLVAADINGDNRLDLASANSMRTASRC
jgi:hypothetical protein